MIIHNKITEEVGVDIVDRYLNHSMSARQIGELYGINTTSISVFLRSKGIKGGYSRKYKVDDSFFKQLDSEEKYYILGLIYSDGYVNEKRNQVVIQLQAGDVDILEKITSILQPTKPLYFSKSKPPRKDKFSLVITSREIVEDLKKLGCRQCKTFNLTWPDFLEPKMARHFLRGVWDGDGYLAECKTEMIATEDFCFGLKLLVKRIFGFNCSELVDPNPDRGNNIRKFQLGGRNQVIQFLRWLYKDCNIVMNRRFQKFVEIDNNYKLNPSNQTDLEGNLLSKTERQNKKNKEGRRRKLRIIASRLLNV